MKKTFFIKTLKTTLKKLKQKNAQLVLELKKIDSLSEKDPEKSSLHEIWHTYSIVNEFKDFTESLLMKQINTA